MRWKGRYGELLQQADSINELTTAVFYYVPPAQHHELDRQVLPIYIELHQQTRLTESSLLSTVTRK